ncbi:HdeD family acid-resistance protein [Vagococcus silagei]|uniref:Acid-resistance membrane protein n=1 Tax=Vagococcus silagei TaxID=2508885 RepID=A0A4S3B9L0_9ENTE|nr:DUF308 domain-containing protein [Vagococcus silagei]THB61785.1 hypothetical protein ESZ54_03155 [Vagococcus silagei]
MISSVFNTFKKFAIIRSIAFISLGIATLLNPFGVFNLLVYIIAGYNFVLGIISLVEALRIKTQGPNLKLIGAVCYLGFALFIFLFANTLVSMLAVFIGIIVLVSGIYKISQAINLKSYVNVPWIPILIYGIILVIVGLVICFKPFETKLIFYNFIGFLLLFSGVSELITYFRLRKFDL